MPEQRTYIAIDLKSFYASVECVDRGEVNPESWTQLNGSQCNGNSV